MRKEWSHKYTILNFIKNGVMAVHMLLQINEDFDDDLLSDAFDLLPKEKEITFEVFLFAHTIYEYG